jgi:hypothetical protein
LGLFSCVRENLIDTIDFPKTEKKIVVIGAISMGDSIQVRVSKSSGIGELYNDTENAVNNANVRLINLTTNESVELTRWKRNSLYSVSQKNFKIKMAEKYQLVINVPNYPTIYSVCQMPTKAAYFESILIHTTKNSKGYNWYPFFTWKDITLDRESTGYAIIFKAINGNPVLSGMIRSIQERDRVNGICTYGDSFFTNRDENSGEIYWQTFGLVTYNDVMKKFFQIRDLSEDINHYSILSDFKGIIPEYTNIQNGLGFFGGYVVTDKTVLIRE